jgi:hypothetical protein
MTPIEALNLVYQVARMAPLNANDHEKVVEAVKILQTAVEPKTKEKSEK